MREPTTSHIPGEDGVEIAVHDYGGDGVPTLFVHGTGMCGRMWEPVMDRLPTDALRPLAIDIRAHGATRTPPGTTFYDHRMTADVVAVIDAFDIVDGLAVAHSMGAAATILASIERPGALAGIWAYEPILMAKTADGTEGIGALGMEFLDGLRRRRAVYESRQQAFDRYSSRPPLDELHHDVLWAYLEHGFVDQDDGTVRLACDPVDEALAFEQFLQDGFSRLGRVTAEVLVAYGGADPEPPAAQAPDIAAAMPKGQAEEFPDSAHFGPFGDLAFAARSIERFLLPLRPSGPSRAQ